MNKYAVISNLETSKPVHALHNLPLHVTLIGIFSSLEQPDYFEPTIKKVAQKHSVVHTEAMDHQNFGDADMPIMVTELENTEQLKLLHQDLISALTAEIKDMNPHFLPKTYRPHVTDQKDRSIQADKEVRIDNLIFVQIDGNHVYEKFRFDLTN